MVDFNQEEQDILYDIANDRFQTVLHRAKILAEYEKDYVKMRFNLTDAIEKFRPLSHRVEDDVEHVNKIIENLNSPRDFDKIDHM